MNFLIFSITALYVITNLNCINARFPEKKCGGLDTEVVIKQTVKNIEYIVCYGQQTDYNEILLPAHCVYGVNKTDLKIETYYKEQRRLPRSVTNIFIHPEFTPCNGQNNLAILTVDKPFNSNSGIICLTDREKNFPSNACENRIISLSDHINKVEIKERCKSISPLKIDNAKDTGEQICEMESNGINALQYHYSHTHICETPGQNAAKYLDKYRTMVLYCDGEIEGQPLYNEAIIQFSDFKTWISKVAKGRINSGSNKNAIKGGSSYNDIDYN